MTIDLAMFALLLAGCGGQTLDYPWGTHCWAEAGVTIDAPAHGYYAGRMYPSDRCVPDSVEGWCCP